MSGQEIQQKPEDSGSQSFMAGGKGMISSKQKGGKVHVPMWVQKLLWSLVWILIILVVVVALWFGLRDKIIAKCRNSTICAKLLEKCKNNKKCSILLPKEEAFIAYNPSDANHAKIHIDPETTYIETYIRSCLGTEK